MKAVHTEEYYRNNWERFINTKDCSDFYMNLEGELEREMSLTVACITAVPEAERETILAVYKKNAVTKIAESANKRCRKQMDIVKRVESGQASLGYVTEQQEYSNRGKMRERFEFNCMQLADFRKKYLAGA